MQYGALLGQMFGGGGGGGYNLDASSHDDSRGDLFGRAESGSVSGIGGTRDKIFNFKSTTTSSEMSWTTKLLLFGLAFLVALVVIRKS